MQPPEGPPVWIAFNVWPPGTPPPITSMISHSLMPRGTSINPVFAILPVSANTFVPLLRSEPMLANHLPPLRTIGATLAYVSTLFSSVGLPHNPLTAGYGGRGFGVPRRPSIDAISAVSSPHTNAPAPSRISTSKLNVVDSKSAVYG